MEKDEINLNEKQAQALELALSGMSDGEIAEQVKVTRQTVNIWRNHDVDFVYMMTLRRQSTREQHQDAINQLIEKSMGVIRKALEDEEDPKKQLETAKFVMRMSGLQGFNKMDKVPTRKEIEEDRLRNAFETAIQELRDSGEFISPTYLK